MGNGCLCNIVIICIVCGSCDERHYVSIPSLIVHVEWQGEEGVLSLNCSLGRHIAEVDCVALTVERTALQCKDVARAQRIGIGKVMRCHITRSVGYILTY